MKRLTAIAAVLTLAMGVMAPAAAAPTPTGEPINILAGTPATFPEDTAFHVEHGWGLVRGDHPAGKFDFRLEIDGVDQGAGALLRYRDGIYNNRTRLFNYPDGFAEGEEHTFTGYWYAPCKWALDNEFYDGECPKKNAPVLAQEWSHTVAFGEPNAG
jgi:hypothetical protein